MFAQLADSSYFDDKIDLFIALAPIVYLGNIEEPMIKKAAHWWRTLLTASKVLGVNEVSHKMM